MTGTTSANPEESNHQEQPRQGRLVCQVDEGIVRTPFAGSQHAQQSDRRHLSRITARNQPAQKADPRAQDFGFEPQMAQDNPQHHSHDSHHDAQSNSPAKETYDTPASTAIMASTTTAILAE